MQALFLTWITEILPNQKSDTIAIKYLFQYASGAAATALVIPLIDTIGIGLTTLICKLQSQNEFCKYTYSEKFRCYLGNLGWISCLPFDTIWHQDAELDRQSCWSQDQHLKFYMARRKVNIAWVRPRHGKLRCYVYKAGGVVRVGSCVRFTQKKL